jgi:uncharacterized protein
MDWLWQSLGAAALMLWQIFWALVLGFSLSACLQVFLRNEDVVKKFGRAGWREMALATLLGAASSSCSYAASATAKTAFKKGAALATALAFMFASTNLVLELGFILWLLLGWKFVLAEIFGAFVLIAVMWLLVKLFVSNKLIESARAHDEMEMETCCCSGGSHSSDDEVVGNSFSEKIRHQKNWKLVADAFISDGKMLWKEIGLGLLIAGVLMVVVPDACWEKLFLQHGAGWLRALESAAVGPLIAAASFACSCGNLPLAAVLWSGGISFGGVIAFIYGDLIIVPLVLIYRKYYGAKPALIITAILYVSMVVAGLVVNAVFSAVNLIPANPHCRMTMSPDSFQWNYTAWLNLVALGVLGVFLTLRPKASLH